MQSHQEIDRRSLVLARAVVSKIDNDPQKKGLEKARSTCIRWHETHTNPYISSWLTILAGDWSEIKRVLLDDSETGIALRQCNPFAGVLSPKERWAIYREFTE